MRGWNLLYGPSPYIIEYSGVLNGEILYFNGKQTLTSCRVQISAVRSELASADCQLRVGSIVQTNFSLGTLFVSRALVLRFLGIIDNLK